MVDSVQQDRKIIERPNEHQNHQSAELSRGVQELKQAESRISRDKEMLRQEADRAARESGQLAEEGDSAIRESLNSMELIGKIAQSNNQVLSVVSDISDQTNLLSPNASIEAARAGIHWKRCVVVALEVRDLVAETRNTAVHIFRVMKETESRISHGTQQGQRKAEVLSKIMLERPGKRGKDLRNCRIGPGPLRL